MVLGLPVQPVLWEFCHPDQKLLKCAKINPTGERPAVGPEDSRQDKAYGPASPWEVLVLSRGIKQFSIAGDIWYVLS